MEKEAGEYSCLMAVAPEDLTERIIRFGKTIDPEDVFDDGDETGLETEPHVTILYGLHTTRPAQVFRLFKDRPSIQASTKGLSLFENDKYDVLKVDIDSNDLNEMNKVLRDKLEYTSGFPDYHPHMTVAYLKAGKGSKYINSPEFDAIPFRMQMLDFSTPERKHTFNRLLQKQAFLAGYCRK